MSGIIKDLGVNKKGEHKWRLLLPPVTLNGKVHRPCHTVIAANEKEAHRKMDALQVKKNDSPIRLSDWANTWIKSVEHRLAPATLHGYKRHLNSHILPELGKVRLDQLNAAKINKFMYALQQTTMSTNTQLKYYRTLSVMIKEAMYTGLITTNPLSQVRAPRFVQHMAEFYQGEDIKNMLAALNTEPLMWRALILTSTYLGIRRGELLALKWKNINFRNNTVTIDHAAFKIKDAPMECKEPKSARSIRTIPMPEALAVVLQEWREFQGGKDDDFVASEKQKKRLRWLNIDTPSRWFHDFVIRHNLPKMNFHGLRHTCATILIDAGIPVTSVSAFVGHSKTSVTTDIYGHDTIAAKQRIAQAMSNALNGQL